MRRWMKILAGVVAVLLLVLLAVALLVNANTFRPVLESRLTQALGRQVTLGSLHFSPFTGSLNADSVRIADDPAFGPEPLLTARSLKIGVNMAPLIFHRKLEVRSFRAIDPRINLVQNAQGTWNFSSLGHSSGQQPASTGSGMSGVSVGQIAVSNGTVTVTSVPAVGPARVYSKVNISVQNFSATSTFPFSLNANMPGDGTVSLDGTAGPINAQDTAATPFQAQLQVRNLNPVTAGFLSPSAGFGMVVDANAKAQSNGAAVNSQGTLILHQLLLTKSGRPIPQPVNLTYNVTQQLKGGAGTVPSAELKVGDTAIHLNGQYRLAEAANAGSPASGGASSANPWINMNASGQNLSIDQLQSLLVAAGVKLPNGSVLRGGTLTLALNATGPVDALVITGPVEIDNSQLAGFDLGSKISGLAALGGIKTGSVTDIQQLKFNLRSAGGAISTDNIYARMPAVGQATGSGTVSPAGALDYQLVVRVTTARGIGQAGVSLLSKLNAAAGSDAKNFAANGVPMRITGTASNPVITADVSGLLRRNGVNILGNTKKANPAGLLHGLFGGK